MSLLEFDDAANTPSSWWPAAADPRATRQWASAIRWQGDGVGFIGLSPAGPFAIVRRGATAGGWARMNAVDVCAGTDRGVTQPHDLLDAARQEPGGQLVAAANGYLTPIRSGTAAPGPDTAEWLIAEVRERAEAEGASFALLHLAADSPIVPVLAAGGFELGITDLYARIEVTGDRPEDFVAAQSAHRRKRMDYELRAFTRRGGHREVLRGTAARSVLPVVAELEASAARARGGAMTSAMALEVDERIVGEFGSSAVVVLVRDGAGRAIASAMMVHTDRAALLRTVGFDPEAARPLGGYFQATVYGPLAVAQAAGLTELLLGPGALTPKLLRGARLTPLLSAAPREQARLVRLLRATDTAMRETLTALTATHGRDVHQGAGSCSGCS